MNVKFSPGPWNVQDNTADAHGQLLVDSAHGAVAICYTIQDGESGVPAECLHNARLIAAAPELFACIKEVLWSHGELNAALWNRMRNAVADASGNAA